MSDNWVVQNLENALATWNEKLAEIWQLITQSPEQFKGGTIWNVVLLIHDTMQAVGLALLVLFFVVGVVKTCGSFAEIKRPEAAVKLFIRFALAKAAVTYGLELMMALFTMAGRLRRTCSRYDHLLRLGQQGRLQPPRRRGGPCGHCPEGGGRDHLHRRGQFRKPLPGEPLSCGTL